MKKLLLTLTIGLLFSLQSNAQLRPNCPHPSRDWDHGNAVCVSAGGGSQGCNCKQKMHYYCNGTYSHSYTYQYYWSNPQAVPCDVYGGFTSTEEETIEVYPMHLMFLEFRDVMMIPVPNQFCDSVLMQNIDTLEKALIYRWSLGGYNVTLTDLDNPCFVPIITLPVIVPIDKPILNVSNCYGIYPNPASTTININFNGHHVNIDKFQLIEVSTNLIQYQKTTSISSLESIASGTFPRGNYKLAFFDFNGNVEYKNIILE